MESSALPPPSGKIHLSRDIPICSGCVNWWSLGRGFMMRYIDASSVFLGQSKDNSHGTRLYLLYLKQRVWVRACDGTVIVTTSWWSFNYMIQGIWLSTLKGMTQVILLRWGSPHQIHTYILAVCEMIFRFLIHPSQLTGSSARSCRYHRPCSPGTIWSFLA